MAERDPGIGFSEGRGILVDPDEFERAVSWCQDADQPGVFNYDGPPKWWWASKKIAFVFTDGDTAFEFAMRFRS